MLIYLKQIKILYYFFFGFKNIEFIIEFKKFFII